MFFIMALLSKKYLKTKANNGVLWHSELLYFAMLYYLTCILNRISNAWLLDYFKCKRIAFIQLTVNNLLDSNIVHHLLMSSGLFPWNWMFS